MSGKRPGPQAYGFGKQKKKTKRERAMKEGSNEEVLLADLRALVASRKALRNDEAETEATSGDDNNGLVGQLPELGTEIDLEVVELSSTGDGLALQSDSDRIYVVPFVAPGDTVRVKVYQHLETHSIADYISITKPSPLRDDTRIACKYFSKCSGCQFQMLEYSEQLRLKKTIVEKAYRNFSQLPPELIPTIQDTIGSPLQYNYRTKLTPHFDGPPGSWRKGRPKVPFEKCPDVGFNQKGKRVVIDIEDCPIGTEAVRLGMTRERTKLQAEYTKYSHGATILLRESTKRYPKDSEDLPKENPPNAVRVETDSHTDIKTCTSETSAMTTEYIDDFLFTNPANSFFQNNNSVLPVFSDYVRQHALPPLALSDPESGPKIKYLIDAYSGSGLFTITLASLFEGSTGIDISKESIDYARKNAKLNSLPESQCNFLAADAPELFKHVKYNADETVVVLDPPRKGCDNDFLSQLLRFGPKRVIYVSCNVHTQARDIGVLVRGEGGDGKKYQIESLRGFDFFPQTGHVEGVAVLNRVEQSAI